MCQGLADRGSDLPQVLELLVALGAMLRVPLDLHGGGGIELSVEVGLDPERLSALHECLPLVAPTNEPSSPPALARAAT